jgi:3-carboxy-cis,cis-muconate cycloisomerase
VADLFAGTYGRGAAAAAASGEAWLAAMLEVEAALAVACENAGLIPSGSAAAIAAACDPSGFDLTVLARDGGEHASVVVPLVRALRARVGSDLADYVHLGATSQDILDTAAMLVSRRALEPILSDASGASAIAAALADRHRSTAVAGRTLLQQALPTSFGLRAAGWTVALDRARERLRDVRAEVPAVQMGGPVGTGSPAVAGLVAGELGLAEPPLPWHTDRTRVAELACGLGTLAGALAKLGRDVTLMAQDEVGELREAGRSGRGGSSAMAHKRNPVAAVSVIACARRVPGLVATILASMEQELERAAGSWQAEWGTLSELLALTGSAAAWGRELLESLEVDRLRMRENLARLAAAGVTEAEAPDLGAASGLIDRALAAHRQLESTWDLGTGGHTSPSQPPDSEERHD